MTARQKKLYKSMSIQEQDMFDYLVHVQDRKPDDVFFSYIQLFNLVVMISKNHHLLTYQLNKLLILVMSYN